MKNLKTRNYEEVVIEELKEDEELLNLYIKNAIDKFKETQDTKVFLFNLRCIIEAKKGVPRVAKKSKLTRQGLYQMLNKQEFKLSNFVAVLHAVGLSLDIKPTPNKYKYL